MILNYLKEVFKSLLHFMNSLSHTHIGDFGFRRRSNSK